MCGPVGSVSVQMGVFQTYSLSSPLVFKAVLTVRRCFLRMYMMKPHILDVTPRKVRMPSRHCRVFSMFMSSQRPPQSGSASSLKRNNIKARRLGEVALVNTEATFNVLLSGREKSASTSSSYWQEAGLFFTLVARLASHTQHYGRNTQPRWKGKKPPHVACCCCMNHGANHR